MVSISCIAVGIENMLTILFWTKFVLHLSLYLFQITPHIYTFEEPSWWLTWKRQTWRVDQERLNASLACETQIRPLIETQSVKSLLGCLLASDFLLLIRSAHLLTASSFIYTTCPAWRRRCKRATSREMNIALGLPTRLSAIVLTPTDILQIA